MTLRKKLCLEGRGPEKLMQIPQRKIACCWNSESAVDSGFPVEVRHEKANHAIQNNNQPLESMDWHFHLLPARPHLGSGRWSHLRRRDAIVNRGLSVEGKKEHQGAERDGHRAPQRLVLHDSKIQSLFCLTRRLRIQDKSDSAAYYTCQAWIGERDAKMRPPNRTKLAPRGSAGAGEEFARTNWLFDPQPRLLMIISCHE